MGKHYVYICVYRQLFFILVNIVIWLSKILQHITFQQDKKWHTVSTFSIHNLLKEVNFWSWKADSYLLETSCGLSSLLWVQWRHLCGHSVYNDKCYKSGLLVSERWLLSIYCFVSTHVCVRVKESCPLQGPSGWTMNPMGMRQSNRRNSVLIGVCVGNPHRHSKDRHDGRCMSLLTKEKGVGIWDCKKNNAVHRVTRKAEICSLAAVPYRGLTQVILTPQ